MSYHRMNKHYPFAKLLSVYKMLAFNLIVFLSLISANAYACSVTSDYYRPSNFELIESADAIIIAKITGSEKGDGYVKGYRSPVFEIVDHIKNDSVTEIASGNFYVHSNPRRQPPRSNPDGISDAHPDSFSGACNRSLLQKGQTYVLFLYEYDGKYDVGGAPFSRIAEDYHGKNSAWMNAINFYLDIQNIPDRYQQLEKLKTEYENLKSYPADSFEHKLSLDVADHLMSYSPKKPTQYLLESYKALEKGETLPFFVRPPDTNPEFDVHPELAAIESLVTGQDVKQTEPNTSLREQQLKQILDALAKGDHPDAISLFDELVARKDVPVTTYAQYFQVLAKAGRYEDLISVADPLAFKLVATANPNDANYIMSALSKVMATYGEEVPLWKREKTTRNWWPNFRVGLIAIYNQRFGHGWSLSKDVIEAVRPENYRDQPDLTLLITESYDKPVRTWAIKEIQGLIDSETIAFDKKFNLPMGVLLSSYRPDNSADLEVVFCHQDKGRAALLKSFGLYQNVYTEKLAYQIAAFGLSDENEAYFLKSLYILAGNYWEDYALRGGWGSSSKFSDLIGIIHRGETVDLKAENLKPIECPVE